ncbi:MAG: hypothetical protein ACFFAT_19285 [Promethearchaeota archaeon]
MLRNIGFNCGRDKDECPQYPSSCNKCIQDHIITLGFEIDTNIKIMEMDSEDKRLQMYQDQIWQEFLNVLNLKHIILLDNKSGMPIINYPVSEAGIDAELLSGFIQANITFSERTSSSNNNTAINFQFYEFQYKNFYILLKNGEYSRICLILDHKQSNSLQLTTRDFLIDFERKYKQELTDLLNYGYLEFPNLQEFIIEAFNVKFLFPMVLVHSIPPDVMDSVKENKIQEAIVKVAKEYLITNQIFFINSLLNEIKNIINVEAKSILYEIYQLIQKKVIIPTTLESAETKVKTFQEKRARKIENSQVISHIITTDDNITALEDLKIKAKSFDENEAKKYMDQFIKKGRTAEKAKIFKEAQKEYEKALFLATGFNFQTEIGKISFMIVELDKKIDEMELEFSLNAAENSERKKNYIDSIRYYKKAINILERDVNSSNIESKIKKFKKKIEKLQTLI